ncbi:beta-ketoacyl synthase N-terminal-like domain-containing protein [Chromobacterium sp. TRC.1.1.SA]|uniref:Beta-ketoacyl synthase N-terminal-like domain-containing protein n=1 Tax=Chromobacterium indicum TaxID=3110228 RepID=A0ABV0CM65_9NEIS
MREVAITGIGVVGPHGVGLDSVFDAARGGRFVFSAWPEAASPPHAESLIASVGDYPRTRYFNERALRLMDKPMMLASFAAGSALEDAGYSDGGAPEDCAALLGTARSEQTSVHKFSLPLLQGRPERINPAEFPLVARNIACGQMAIRFGLRGPSSVLASGPLASLQAVARAAGLIRSGRAEIALAGGVEALSRFGLRFCRDYYGDAALAGRPAFFGERGGGLIPSEGACMLVLEDAERAAARGARVYARLGGWHAGRLGRGDAVQSLLDGWRRAADAEPALLLPGAGGAGRDHERLETRALRRWLAERAGRPCKLLAARALAGEGESWSGALQVALAAASLASRRAPATPDVAADADPALAQAAAGGALPDDAAALVLGNDAAGAFCALGLRR